MKFTLEVWRKACAGVVLKFFLFGKLNVGYRQLDSFHLRKQFVLLALRATPEIRYCKACQVE